MKESSNDGVTATRLSCGSATVSWALDTSADRAQLDTSSPTQRCRCYVLKVRRLATMIPRRTSGWEGIRFTSKYWLISPSPAPASRRPPRRQVESSSHAHQINTDTKWTSVSRVTRYQRVIINYCCTALTPMNPSFAVCTLPSTHPPRCRGLSNSGMPANWQLAGVHIHTGCHVLWQLTQCGGMAVWLWLPGVNSGHSLSASLYSLTATPTHTLNCTLTLARLASAHSPLATITYTC